MTTRCQRSRPSRFPEHERVAGLERLEASGKTRTRVVPAGGEVLVNPFRLDAGGEQGVTLRRQGLAAVAFRDPDVADKHG